jgi:hypothetical protein
MEHYARTYARACVLVGQGHAGYLIYLENVYQCAHMCEVMRCPHHMIMQSGGCQLHVCTPQLEKMGIATYLQALGRGIP